MDAGFGCFLICRAPRPRGMTYTRRRLPLSYVTLSLPLHCPTTAIACDSWPDRLPRKKPSLGSAPSGGAG